MKDLDDVIRATCDRMQEWLRSLPAWRMHPATDDGGVAAHYGPTLLSEADCVMHFARFLADTGVSWEDMHFELGPAKWLWPANISGGAKWKPDLAIIGRDRLLAADLPDKSGALRFDAFVEFKLASAYWKHGTAWGAPQSFHNDLANDAKKVAGYLERGLCLLGVVVVVEEEDAKFPPTLLEELAALHADLQVRILSRWAPAATG